MGVVAAWHGEDGWGVIESMDTATGCWVHFGNIWTLNIRLSAVGNRSRSTDKPRTSKLARPSTLTGCRRDRMVTHSEPLTFARVGSRHGELWSSGSRASGFHGRSIASANSATAAFGLKRPVSANSRMCTRRCSAMMRVDLQQRLTGRTAID